MDLLMIGINFRSAPVEVRERLSFNAHAVPNVLGRLAEAHPEFEFVLVSTCNRTELYAAGPGIEDHLGAVLDSLLEGSGSDDAELRRHMVIKTRVDAVEHLFAVAAGLDSMVVGEAEILGQVKQAYSLSLEAETSGDRLHPLFQNAFKTAKRIRTHTGVCRGRVSVSTIAVEFVEKIFDNLSTKTVMIVGAGETAELVLKCLVERGPGELLVLNRSQPKCQSLAERYGGRALPFDAIDECLPRADIVMSSTSAPHCIVRTAAVRRAMRERQGRPMLFMDIAVPRDIEPGIAEIDNVYLYDIDDLQKIAADNLAKRQAEVEKARRIVREDAAEMAALFGRVDFGSLMKLLDRRARHAGGVELERLFAKPLLADLSDAQRAEIAAVLGRAVNRILGPPRKALRRASRESGWDTYAGIARDLFGLDEEEGNDGDGADEPPRA